MPLSRSLSSPRAPGRPGCKEWVDKLAWYAWQRLASVAVLGRGKNAKERRGLAPGCEEEWARGAIRYGQQDHDPELAKAEVAMFLSQVERFPVYMDFLLKKKQAWPVSYTAKRQTIALVAHDGAKQLIRLFVRSHCEELSNFSLTGTATTCAVLRAEGLEPESPTCSGPLGGDQQIATMITEGKVEALFFLRDPLGTHPHSADVEALLRIADCFQVLSGTTFSTASAILMRMSAKVKADMLIDAGADMEGRVVGQVAKRSLATGEPCEAEGDESDEEDSDEVGQTFTMRRVQSLLSENGHRLPTHTQSVAMLSDESMYELVQAFVREHRTMLMRCSITASAWIAAILREAGVVTERLVRIGPFGGAQQIGAMVAEGKITAVFMFVDPFSPASVDNTALLRLAECYQVYKTTNYTSASAVLSFMDACCPRLSKQVLEDMPSIANMMQSGYRNSRAEAEAKSDSLPPACSSGTSEV